MHFRDELKRNYNLGRYFVNVSIENLDSFNEQLADALYKNPSEYLPVVRTVLWNLTHKYTKY